MDEKFDGWDDFWMEAVVRICKEEGKLGVGRRNPRYNEMLYDIYMKTDSGANIAKKYGSTPGWISQVKQKIMQLKYNPKIKDGHIVCYNCDNEDGELVIHHDHETGQQIAIICNSCNHKYGLEVAKIKDEEEGIVYRLNMKNRKLDERLAHLNKNMETIKKLFELGKVKVYKEKLTPRELIFLEEL